MNVSLTPELERFVQDRVDSGLYGSASEVVRDGLRLLRERALLERRQFITELNQFVEDGLEDSRRGRVLSGDEAYSRSTARLQQLRKK